MRMTCLKALAVVRAGQCYVNPKLVARIEESEEPAGDSGGAVNLRHVRSGLV